MCPQGLKLGERLPLLWSERLEFALWHARDPSVQAEQHDPRVSADSDAVEPQP